MYSRIKIKNQHKKHRCMSVYKILLQKKILDQHKKQCLLINGCQAVNYESRIKKIKNMNNKY